MVGTVQYIHMPGSTEPVLLCITASALLRKQLRYADSSPVIYLVRNCLPAAGAEAMQRAKNLQLHML